MDTQGKRKWLQRIRWEELIVPLLSIFFSLIFLSQVWGEPRIVVLWPYIIMALLIGCSALIVLKGLKEGWRQEAREEKAFAGIWPWMKIAVKPLLISGTTVIYLAGVDTLGFTLSNFLYLMILIWCLGTRKTWTLIGLSLVITVILHVVMIDFLQMPVPTLTIPWIKWPI
ncbi:MAG: tripartite tricarboxylate transporter TctB family protein [Pseudomonadota bacterium]